MKATEQGVGPGAPRRYQAVPRTLIFLLHRDPQGQVQILLLKGAPDKRLWAGRYNGLGGHVEPDEDILAAAERELAEEAGIQGVALALRGVLHITVAPQDPTAPGILVFVFLGWTQDRRVAPSREGELAWFPVDQLAELPLVDDLHHLLPRLLQGPGFVHGLYRPGADGRLEYHFRVEEAP